MEGVDITEEEILRWNVNARPLPLPPSHTPVGGAPLSTVSDEALMNMPPHMIAHVQRTAAQGGLQIISPRQIPFSTMMLRTKGGSRVIGDHVVGSVAVHDDEWPTLDNADFSHLLPDEPLAPSGSHKVMRTKTRAAAITTSTQEMVDPILACLVKGRAVVDILRRDDVLGGADEFVEVLSQAWGIEPEELEDMDAFTLGIQGPLLRHAIKADEVYSTFYAPIHVRKCVSVGTSEINRHFLPVDSAMDWRRMRVHAEAVFALTCAIEGHPIKMMACVPPPGDTSAPTNRPNVMCFQPAPATAWTFDPGTFSLMPVVSKGGQRCSAIPRDVMRALARHVEVVRPLSYALMQGHRAFARESTSVAINAPYKETITAGFTVMYRELSLGLARGRSSAASIRNLIYTTLENAPLAMRLRIARFMKIAKDEVRKHLGLETVPDSMISRLANRFLSIGDTIRLKVAGEASQRGGTVETWWADILAQAPDRYRGFVEGTKGWANVAMWLLFREPTDKWERLSTATHLSALRDAEVASIGAMNLPIKKGSPERLLEAMVQAVKGITKVYAGYYRGVSDVGYAMSDVATEMKRPRTAAMLKEAAFLWILRARCFCATNVDLLKEGEQPTSKYHLVIEAKPRDVVIKPAPYKAYEAYQKHVEGSEILRATYRKHIVNSNPKQISKAFEDWHEPAFLVEDSTLTRYLHRPSRLAEDMESGWGEITDDLQKVAKTYGAEEIVPVVKPPAEPPTPVQREYIPVNMTCDTTGGMDYWTVTAGMDEDEIEWIEALFLRIGGDYEDLFIERRFSSIEQIRSELIALDRAHPKAAPREREAVR